MAELGHSCLVINVQGSNGERPEVMLISAVRAVRHCRRNIIGDAVRRVVRQRFARLTRTSFSEVAPFPSLFLVFPGLFSPDGFAYWLWFLRGVQPTGLQRRTIVAYLIRVLHRKSWCVSDAAMAVKRNRRPEKRALLADSERTLGGPPGTAGGLSLKLSAVSIQSQPAVRRPAITAAGAHAAGADCANRCRHGRRDFARGSNVWRR